jgi:hypothetical protein
MEPSTIIWTEGHGTKTRISCHICTVNAMGPARSQPLFWVLLESGSIVSVIKRLATQARAITKEVGKAIQSWPLYVSWKLKTSSRCKTEYCQNLTKKANQPTICFSVCHENVKYGMILGTNFLSKIGIRLNYSIPWESWNGSIASFH